jgi:hypothetical protein
VPLRSSQRLVVAGLATLVAALLVITLVTARSAPSPDARAVAGAQTWAMIERLLHRDAPSTGAIPGGSTPAAPPAPASTNPGDPVVAQPPPAAVVTPGRIAAIDRRPLVPRQAPTAPPPSPGVVVPPRTAASAAPLPAPAPVAPAPSLLSTVTSLVATLLGLLIGG